MEHVVVPYLFEGHLIRPLAQLTQFDQIMQIHSQQDPKLRTSSLFHANIQETSQKAKVIPVIYWD